MHRHQKLCAHAVDALEIAAGLEAHGVTDRTAARFRHRDVFSLAEELYARVPRAEQGTPEAGGGWGRGWGGRCGAVLQLLPGAVCGATVAALASVGETAAPASRMAVAAAGVVLLALAVRLAVRSGPLRARHQGAGSRTAGLWVCWTLGYAVFGDRLLAELLAGGPDLPYAHPRPAVAAAVALSCAVLPAAGCARWFAVRGRRGLAASRGLGNSPPAPGRCCSPPRRSSWARWWRCCWAPERSSRAAGRRRWPRRPRWACCSSSPGCSPSTASPRRPPPAWPRPPPWRRSPWRWC
ncbi:hypothetical protein [Streptomyces sirii]|uniref:hypothetical protein n=1 Tax=Streptomyces sirii TaxID=3127701 RepID=UPI003D35BAD1